MASRRISVGIRDSGGLLHLVPDSFLVMAIVPFAPNPFCLLL